MVGPTETAIMRDETTVIAVMTETAIVMAVVKMQAVMVDMTTPVAIHPCVVMAVGVNAK
jgi:hypothetical protein